MSAIAIMPDGQKRLACHQELGGNCKNRDDLGVVDKLQMISDYSRGRNSRPSRHIDITRSSDPARSFISHETDSRTGSK